MIKHETLFGIIGYFLVIVCKFILLSNLNCDSHRNSICQKEKYEHNQIAISLSHLHVNIDSISLINTKAHTA
jgi:hypothetical protein